MKIHLTAYLISALLMLVLDGLWLSLMSKPFYGKYLGHLMAEAPYILPAVIFYIIYILGLVIFVIGPGVAEGQSLLRIFLLGALFGLVAYGTYDLTNHATLRNWPLIVTLTDLVWGTLLTGTVSIATAIILKALP